MDNRWWFSACASPGYWYGKWAPCESAQLKKLRSQQPVSTGERVILHSWTGRLTGDGSTFNVPLCWSEYLASVESNRSTNVAPVRLRVFVSRVVDGELRTLRCFLDSHRRDSDQEENTLFIHGQSLDAPDSYEENEFSLVPELSMEIDLTEDLEAEEADDEEDHHVHYMVGNSFEVTFWFYQPESDSERMTPDQLLRYLEYGLPWRG